MSYWLIKVILLLALVVVMVVMVKPVKSASHLAMRRLLVLLMVVFAAFAIIFPGTMNQLAWSIGVVSGVNLLVYLLVISFFGQVVSGYRRDAANERKVTLLARAIALQSAPTVPEHLRSEAPLNALSNPSTSAPSRTSSDTEQSPKSAGE